MKNKLTKLEFKWICYDMGNSAFILLVATILPIYFNYLSSSQGVAEHNYLSYWSYAASLSTLIVALAGPILGTLADYKDHKKKIFLTCAMLGALALACFWIPSSWLAFLVLFIAAKVAYSLSLIVYDSMLTDITTEERMDAVSSKGYAWGYIASVVPFIISLIFVLMYDKIGMTLKTAMMIAFILNAVWWIASTLPLVKSYKQKYYIEPEAHPALDTFARLKDTLMKAKEQKKVFLFLFAFFFYIDGVYTIIDMATAYGTSLGLNTTGLLLALLLTQIVAFPASLTFAVLSKTKDTASLIKVAIIAYFLIALFAVQLDKQWEFWVLAVAVGCFQGGIQALSRSYFAKIIPENASGEYFGLFDICGKGASFLGTMLIGVVTQITGKQNLGVAALSIMFVIGYLIFNKVSKMDD
ncbi:MFS transporter [Eubacterium sp. AM28-29]|uniref:MFS transporter n=1 Tax=Holdemanella porci TaxID=2652276 RepID=UPI000E4F9071|nr:MFS transporter [Holdemanella porci]RHE42991.1 MFS transporter [Eubacterium sp. AM28-29]